MLWRAHYTPEIYEAAPDWSIANGVYCGAGSVSALIDAQVWMKLFGSAQLNFAVLVVGPISSADSVLPPSALARLRSVSADDRLPADRAFGLVKSDLRIMFVVGPPTEDVWEQFEGFAKELS